MLHFHGRGRRDRSHQMLRKIMGIRRPNNSSRPSKNIHGRHSGGRSHQFAQKKKIIHEHPTSTTADEAVGNVINVINRVVNVGVRSRPSQFENAKNHTKQTKLIQHKKKKPQKRPKLIIDINN